MKFFPLCQTKEGRAVQLMVVTVKLPGCYNKRDIRVCLGLGCQRCGVLVGEQWIAVRHVVLNDQGEEMEQQPAPLVFTVGRSGFTLFESGPVLRYC
jgi:hypothetical protein